ncbi:MAG: hypothetical protein ABIO45_08640 [Burkholderiaceae bacterium]
MTAAAREASASIRKSPAIVSSSPFGSMTVSPSPTLIGTAASLESIRNGREVIDAAGAGMHRRLDRKGFDRVARARCSRLLQPTSDNMTWQP